MSYSEVITNFIRRTLNFNEITQVTQPLNSLSLKSQLKQKF